jgi:hypothetical protein
MSVTSARDWQQAERSQSPLWVTGVTVALLALGFSHARASHPAGSIPSARQARITTERGRGRSAATPSEFPARGCRF